MHLHLSGIVLSLQRIIRCVRCRPEWYCNRSPRVLALPNGALVATASRPATGFWVSADGAGVKTKPAYQPHFCDFVNDQIDNHLEAVYASDAPTSHLGSDIVTLLLTACRYWVNLLRSGKDWKFWNVDAEHNQRVPAGLPQVNCKFAHSVQT